MKVIWEHTDIQDGIKYISLDTKETYMVEELDVPHPLRYIVKKCDTEQIVFKCTKAELLAILNYRCYIPIITE